MARKHARKHTILAVMLLSAAPVAASPGAGSGRKPPPPDERASPALIELRSDLIKNGRAGAQQEPGKFRPLCDAEGYPLVGNLANKKNVYQPSQYCAEVRRAGK